MKIKIIALGKIKEKFLKDGIDEFMKRLTPYASVEIVELQPVEIKDENLIEKALLQESEKILSNIKNIVNRFKDFFVLFLMFIKIKYHFKFYKSVLIIL